MNYATKKCFGLLCRQSDIATDWLLDYLTEADELEKKINFLQYQKADRKRRVIARRLNKLCQI